MDDRLIMDNYLLVLKSTVEVFVHGTLESSNADIRDLLKSGLDHIIKHQAATYDKMVEFGWYVVSNVETKSINKTLNNLCNKK